MAQKSGFFTSSSGDRKYGSDWLAQYIAAIISNGVYTTELTASGDNGNMSVTVGAGRAWINGYMYSNDSDMTLALSAADGALSRTDLIVLRLDMTNRQITLTVVQGDFGGGVPALTRTSDIYELCLAQIAVAAGTTEITAQMITDTRADETVCGIVAGAVTQLSTGDLLEQLKAGFEEWFEGIKGQLSEDAAGNLQNQINDCVKSDDKATEEEASTGTDDTKWITPAKVKLAAARFKLIQEYTVAGSYTFVPPKNARMLVLMIGAGGSGGVVSKISPSSGYAVGASGGSSGCVNMLLKSVTTEDEIACVVGAGGAAQSTSNTAGSGLTGNNGGSTSFDGNTAPGGIGGNAAYSSDTPTCYGCGSDYSQSSRACGYTRNTSKFFTPYGFEYVRITPSNGLIYSQLSAVSIKLAALLNQLGKMPFNIAAGGQARVYYNSSAFYATLENAVTFEDTVSSGGALQQNSSAATAVKGTDPGCGGGGAVSIGGVVTSAAGADGGIFIYEVLE